MKGEQRMDEEYQEEPFQGDFTIVFLRHNDFLLLLRRAEDKEVFPGFYNGLGGRVEEGETPQEAARREVREEAGVEPEDLQEKGVIIARHFLGGWRRLYFYLGTVPSFIPPSTPEGHLEWVPLSRLSQIPLVPDLQEILPRLLRLSESHRLDGEYIFDGKDRLLGVQVQEEGGERISHSP